MNTPETERPRERCLEQGPECLSLRECLAILLGSGPKGKGCMGVARELLEKGGAGFSPADEERAFFNVMETHGRAHVLGIGGLGAAGQARILAAFEIGRRYARFREVRMRATRSLGRTNGRLSSGGAPEPAGACDFDRPIVAALTRVPPRRRDDPREWLGFVPVYPRGSVGDLCVVEHGVRTHVNVEPAELFARVLALRPAAIVLFHNHPSGLLEPSSADADLTRRVRTLAGSLGIELLGHWIVTSTGEVLV